ncbi:unnamed protein product [Rhizophagus irregularis]|nr:unnamed protein product [Rhizophagus irregularis]
MERCIKSSDSLLIDISQLKKLKINDNNLPEQKYSVISIESQDSLQIDISQLSDQNSDKRSKGDIYYAPGYRGWFLYLERKANQAAKNVIKKKRIEEEIRDRYLRGIY